MSIKESIEKIYKKNTNYAEPEHATNLVASLNSLSSDLYTDSKRFIYELLQNADDSSENNQLIEVEIKLFKNYLVVAHTGKVFDKDDIRGICNLDSGTKKSSINKTGFKGIGFKSVFGQSDKVIIFSNNEYFKFDKNHDFEWKDNWDSTQEEWEKVNNKKFFYPWQIIPIYMSNEKINSDIKSFLSEKWKVATIIELFKVTDVTAAIEELSNNVNMFLFLKNINSVKFHTDKETFIEIDRTIDNELILKKNNELVSTWLTNIVNLSVSNSLKESLQNERNIPDKLLDTQKIELILAIKKGVNGLEILSSNDNLLYTYLPTDEKRYSFPILVNTTFLTSANRESLHTDSKWNQWLFKSISIELFKWISVLIRGEYLFQAYNLIPQKLTIYDDLSNAYNKGIQEAIESISFILSKKGTLLKVSEAITDETSLVEKDFIDEDIVRNFIKNKIGTENHINDQPFVSSHSKLKKIGVESFSWNDIPAFFAFNEFSSKHTIEKNIKLIKYFKNESEINNSSFPKEKLKNWAFVYDHKGKLNYLSKLCFPKIDDDNWNNLDSDLNYVNESLYNLSIEDSKLRLWFQKYGVEEKTDVTYLNTVIIPNATSYCTNENHNKTIKYIYDLYHNEDIKSDTLNQLTNLSLLTTKGTLIPASKCYFSNDYNPKLQVENILNSDIFLSKDYLSLDDNKDEIKRFFKFLGVQENITPIIITSKESKVNLITNFNFKNEYFLESDKKFKPWTSTFTADEYKNIIYIRFLDETKIFNFSKLFWKDLINNSDIITLKSLAQAYWGNSGYPGRNSGDTVENYLKWFIKNNNCIPTTKETCEKSTKIFLNSEDIQDIAGKYLPVFSGIELNQDWKSFFQFKTELKLDDYLKILTNIINDKDEKDKIKDDNIKRVQLIFRKLLKLSSNLEPAEIEKIKYWASSGYLVDENGNIFPCNKLKYYSDGDNSIFQNLHNFIALNQENKSHQNIETLLEYFQIEILRQSSFSIETNGEKSDSDLKYQLEIILPFLKKWISKVDSNFDITYLEESLNSLKITESNKLYLSYDGNTLKSVQVHLEEDRLIITAPWDSNKSMLELPKILCKYFKINGYEDKLGFLLKSNESEIIEYFENEKIEVPIEPIFIKMEESFIKEKATVLNITDQEYNDISNNYKHISESSAEKREYILTLLPRAKKRVLEHLNSLDEYNCDNVDQSALTVLSGIIKNGNNIYIIPRPSDNGKVILHYPSEFDTLEYSDSELWYEDGKSTPKKLTFGKLLRDAKINKIPIERNEKEKIIDIINTPGNEEVAFEAILPSSFVIAKTIASLANTNGGYFIIGYSEENGIVGINNEFHVDEVTKKSISYLSYFENYSMTQIIIDNKKLIVIKVRKSNENILIDNKKYIRVGSIIKEDLENTYKPLIFTEGKTDWKHMKKALERFQKLGIYSDLDIQFKEYEDMDMGDIELDRMVQTYCKNEQSKKHIFIFDRDNNKLVSKYGKEKFNNHDNNVYSFCIPSINNELDEICIEWYYKENDLKKENNEGKRIFLGKEFLPNGNSICGKYVTEKRNTKPFDILDRDKKVYLKIDNKWENNIALSKNDFTNNIINNVEGFNDFDIEYFKLIFDLISEIIDN
ncbi:ATP-binding protein [Aliarcobacter cryaerophilus]|uniref:AlbA family DNA-binding domain-containing protein n=1 Tax=Aliarcobacter cryaerophilus TaxID=28198 RepID=UPI003DA43A5A